MKLLSIALVLFCAVACDKDKASTDSPGDKSGESATKATDDTAASDGDKAGDDNADDKAGGAGDDDSGEPAQRAPALGKVDAAEAERIAGEYRELRSILTAAIKSDRNLDKKELASCEESPW